MKLKRRQFLGSLALVFSGICGVNLLHRYEGSVALAKAIAKHPETENPEAESTEVLLRFVSVADTGTGAKGQYDVAKAMENYRQQNPYNLVILAGDNIYNDGEIEKIEAVFERPYQPLLAADVKFHACLGNHDIRTKNGVDQLNYAGFNMTGRYYTFMQENVQFFALDTNGNADWTNQLIWLEKELSASQADWKIVFGHHPIYSSGAYGSNDKFIKTLAPLFQKYNVQLYINGHEHSYERTESINGTTYLTCGAGAGSRPVGRSEWTAYSTSNLSFAAYDIYANHIEVSGIGTDNRIFDSGLIPLHSAG